MRALFLREVFRCPEILDRFLRGETPSVPEFAEALFVTERRNDRSRPDHFYRAAFEQGPGQWTDWRDVVKGTLRGLSEAYLERGGRNHICVRHDRFSEWQSVIGETSPLAVVTWRLVEEFGFLPFAGPPGQLQTAIERIVMPQIRHSAIPTVHEPQLDRLITRHGLDDLHVHLNGSSEMERVWLDTLERPRQFIAEFLKQCRKEKLIRELLQQDEPGLTQEKFIHRVRTGSRILQLLIRVTAPALLDPGNPLHLYQDHPGAGHRYPWVNLINMEQLDIDSLPLNRLPFPPGASAPTSLSNWPPKPRAGHPLQPVLTNYRGCETLPPLTAEAVLLAGAYQRLDDEDGETVAQILFVYLSLMCLFGRSIVQQRSQIGFDQFQKITLNGVREALEQSTYLDRLEQAQYTRDGDIDVLEGRLAPKEHMPSMVELLKVIDRSYRRYLGEPLRLWEELLPPAAETSRTGLVPARQVELRLVPHFIKLPDNRAVTTCRHYKIRQKLRRQAQVAAKVAANSRRIRKVPIVGFDGAANELHAPPEIFAPVFRYLRRQGHRNFTFHAGEDFRHLASGIRAVAEAVTFLEMTTGNRIGHGTAIGIDPSLWRDRIGATVVLPSHDWLDDLVFGRQLLLRAGAVSQAMHLSGDIARLSGLIYRRSITPECLYRAWAMRHLDPLVAFFETESRDALESGHAEEVHRIRKMRDDREAYGLWLEYHGKHVVERGGTWITLGGDTFEDPFTPDMLGLMQEEVLSLLRERRIVLETLPTSNVRISYYHAHHEHHALRWLGLTGQAAQVDVVVGSDDPGIFATNMRNEYAHLLREISARCPTGSSEALDHIERLIENGKAWRFK